MGPVVAGVVLGLFVGWIVGRSALRSTGARKNYRDARGLMPGLRKTAFGAGLNAARNFIIFGFLLAALVMAWLDPR
jgi:hypothetical protein